MIQLIGFLLCAYMVAKGFEFLHRSACAPKERSWAADVIAVLMFIFCLGCAVFFAYALVEQGSSPSLPPSLRQ